MVYGVDVTRGWGGETPCLGNIWPSCGTVVLYGLFIYLFFLADHRATDFTLSKICGTARRIRRTFQQSFRYIFFYRFSYLLTYYYSFLDHYNEKCFDINWFHLLSPVILSLWFSRFDVTWLLRDDSNSKTRVRFVYMKNLKMLNESSPQLE